MREDGLRRPRGGKGSRGKAMVAGVQRGRPLAGQEAKPAPSGSVPWGTGQLQSVFSRITKRPAETGEDLWERTRTPEPQKRQRLSHSPQQALSIERGVGRIAEGRLHGNAPFKKPNTVTTDCRRYRSYTSAPFHHSNRGFLADGRPAGMVNLGNTCYLNAVLQALLGLPSLPAELRHAAATLAAELPARGVLAALLECAAARDSGTGRVSPAAVKRAMGARVSAFRGSLQHDAHEFFCELLEAVQAEVLGVEAARLGRRNVRVSETADPATRVFGFAVEHELTCRACGESSTIIEQFTHLSLEVEGGEGGSAPGDVNAMLAAFFADEQVDKTCERCGGGVAGPHLLCHRVRRLPRVLALHMKRFRVERAGGGALACRKVTTRVAIPVVVRVKGLCVAEPALPLAPTPDAASPAGKENSLLPLPGGVASPLRGPSSVHTKRRPSGGLVAALPHLLDPSPLPGALAFLPEGRGCREEQRELEEALARSAAEQAQRARPHAVPAGGMYSGDYEAPWSGGDLDHLYTARAVRAQGAASPSYWDPPPRRPAASRAGWSPAPRAAGEQESAELAAVLEASRREAEEAEAGQDEALASALRASLAEQGQRCLQGDAPEGAAEAEAAEAAELGGQCTLIPAPAPAPAPAPLPEVVEDDVDVADSGAGPPTAAARVPPLTMPPLPQYCLSAVINHHGAQAASGHFTADVRDARKGDWYRHDDSHVRPITVADATDGPRQRECYILLYVASQ